MMSIRPKKFNVTPEKPIATRFFLVPFPPARLLSRFVAHPETAWNIQSTRRGVAGR